MAVSQNTMYENGNIPADLHVVITIKSNMFLIGLFLIERDIS